MKKKKIESTKPQVIVSGSKTVTFQQTGLIQTYVEHDRKSGKVTVTMVAQPDRDSRR